MATDNASQNPRKSRRDLEQENEDLWEKLEDVYDLIGELLDDEDDE